MQSIGLPSSMQSREWPLRSALHARYQPGQVVPGARLPTEAEWALAVARYAEGSATDLAQVFDAAWQWAPSG